MKSHWLDRERLRVYPRAMLVLYLVLGALSVLRAHDGVDPNGKPLGADFVAFWSAAQLARDGHAAAAYDQDALFAQQTLAVPGTTARYSWQHPPTFLVLMLPLSLLPYLWACALFIAVTLSAWLWVMRHIAPMTGTVLLALSFSGTFLNIFQGQTGFLVAALFGAGLLLLEQRPFAAGLVLGLLVIKPHLALLLPLALACGRQWRAFLGAAIGASSLVLLSLWCLGAAPFLAFFAKLPQVADWVASGQLPLAKMPSVFGAARLLGMPTTIAAGLHVVLVLPVVAAMAWMWRTDAEVELRNAALVCASLLCTPYLFDYDLVLLGPGLAWFAVYALRHGWRVGEREVLVACWALPLLSGVLASLASIPAGPLLLLAMFGLILRRAWRPLAAG